MQQIQLSIPEPCHQDWQQMTPTEQGRFCNACAKQVVDFSMMTDTQVLHYFLNKKDEKVCGRAYPDQLERAITLPKEPKKRLFWHWNYITMLFLFFSKTNTAKAQGDVRVKTIQTDSIKPNRYYNYNVDKKVIVGKVTDNNGDPIPFASIRTTIGKNGLSADALGNFSIKAHTEIDILEISANGYFKAVFVLKGLTSYNFILTKDPDIKEVLVGGVACFFSDGLPVASEQPPKHVAIIQVKDNTTGRPIAGATINIRNASALKEKSVVADKEGVYKLKKIEEDETYLVKVSAPGYQANDFKITGDNIKNRKIITEVLLNKTQNRRIVMGGVSSSASNKGLLYVLDGKKVSADDINTDNVEDVTMLLGPAAAALFGPDGANGAMVVTSKKPVYKKLDTVVVNSYPAMGKICRLLTGQVVAEVTVKRTLTDSIKSVITNITGDLKIYPNPVQKGNAVSIALKLKQTGVNNIQIINAAGLIVLQKQSTATAKQYIEQVQTGKEWSSGIYYVSIFDSNNKMISTSNFLIQ